MVEQWPSHDNEQAASAGSGFRPPDVPAHHLPRRRLLRLLMEAVARPLTLVVAPAGTGKTTLVAGWAAEATDPVAWLTLDGQDGDPVRLEAVLDAALDTLAPGPMDGPAEVDGPSRRTVLVIDDAHAVDAAPGAVDLLARFVGQRPPWLHLVIVARRDPVVPLDRLRGRGQLAEIRFAELRFTPEESCDALARHDPTLVGADADAVAEQAQGWAVVFELAATVARSARASNEGFPPDLGGALVRDYVLHEVLAGEPPELRDALSDVAVVRDMGLSLAKALTERSDAADLLRRAESRGLFVSRRAGRARYAVHPLVRAALLDELATDAPERLADRHARAARWYEDVGETVPALDHWLRAGRPRDALALLAAQHAALYDRGLEAVVAQTISRIPVAVANTDVASMIEYAWCHLLVDRHRFAELVEKVAWWERRESPPSHLRDRITVLRSIAATVEGRWRAGGALAREATASMGEGWWQDPLGRFGWNMVAREVALSERWSDTGDEVHEAELALSRDPERSLAFEGTRALGEALAGRPVDALRVVAGVREVAEVANMTILRYESRLAEALAQHELGDRAAALPVLQELATTPAGTMLFCQVLAAVQLVQARLDDGQLAAARLDLDTAEELVAVEAFGPDGRSWVARVGTLVALAEGAVDDARTFADQVDDPFWGPVSGARVDLAAGTPADADAALRLATPRCGRHEVVRALLRARAAGDRGAAVHLVTAAVEQAVALNLLQTVASEGVEIVQLVERAAWRAPEEWMRRLRRAGAVAGVPAAGAADSSVGSLTARERDVLRLLAGRLTVREIAGELYVSPNTLKFHLKTIYRKLGVGSRAEAADVARGMTKIQPT